MPIHSDLGYSTILTKTAETFFPISDTFHLFEQISYILKYYHKTNKEQEKSPIMLCKH